MDELLPPQTGDDQDSQITFNVNNLNYVKKKLFDPEIQYLTKKFKEQLQEESDKLQQQQLKLFYDMKKSTNEEVQTYKVLNTQ